MNKTLYKKTFLLAVVSVACQLVNIIRDIVLAKTLGASSLNDIYLVSQSVISLFVSMVNSPLATAYVPVATKYFVSNDKKERNSFLSTIYSDILLLSVILIAVARIFVNPIIQVMAPGFNVENKKILVIMLSIQLPIIAINLIKGIDRGNFQIFQSFNISEITNIIPNIFMVAYLILVGEYVNIYVVAITLTVGTFISLIPEVVLLRKKGIRFRFRPGFNKDIETMLKLMVAALITTAIREVNVVVDQSVGSLLPSGSITMLSYGSKITVVVVSLFSTSVSIVGFANIAKLQYENNENAIFNIIENSLNVLNFIIIPVAGYFIVFAEDIVNILYVRGNFSHSDGLITANIIRFYSIGLIGYGFQDVLTRSLHAFKIVKCTMKASAIMVGTNVVLDLLLYRKFGVNGLAFATTVSMLVIIPGLIKDSRKYIGRYNLSVVIKESTKIFIATLLTALVGLFLDSKFGGSISSFIINSLICGGVYVSCCFLLKSLTLQNIVEIIKSNRNKI